MEPGGRMPDRELAVAGFISRKPGCGMRDRVDARVWVYIAISKRRCDSGKVVVYQVLVLHRGSRGSPGHGIEYPGEQAELSSSHGSSQVKDDGCEGHSESGERRAFEYEELRFL
jgi:hypothetical protein